MSPIVLERKIKRYVNEELLKHILEISAEDFEDFKSTTSGKIISFETNPFVFGEDVIVKLDVLRHLYRASKQDLHEFVKEHFVTSSTRRKLSIHIWSSGLKDQLETAYSRLRKNVDYFNDPEELKKVFEYFPFPDGALGD